MTDHDIRFFTADHDVRDVGERMIACTLPKAEWTHEAHLATCLWLIAERPDIDAERDLPMLIPRYNESVGGVNDATQGYHHTITLTYVAAVRDVLERLDPDLSLAAKVNALLEAPEGRRDWPLMLYSPARLFSVDARLGYLAPDLASGAASDVVSGA